MTESIAIHHRFQGPPMSANGGYVCGRLASGIEGPATVRLNHPPPLETELFVRRNQDRTELLNGNQVLAEARRTTLSIDVPPPPSFAEAVTASHFYRGFTSHPFPGCFVCGPDRKAGDGLRLFPGPTSGRPMVAGPWIPDDSLADPGGVIQTEFLWAALDCPGAFSFEWPPGGTVLLGEMAALIEGSIQSGEKCVVIGWEMTQEGRKHHTGTAIFTAAGICIGKARATWFKIGGAT
jgi:hypothetical protein